MHDSEWSCHPPAGPARNVYRIPAGVSSRAAVVGLVLVVAGDYEPVPWNWPATRAAPIDSKQPEPHRAFARPESIETTLENLIALGAGTDFQVLKKAEFCH